MTPFLTRNALAAIRVRFILAMGQRHHCETYAPAANDNPSFGGRPC